VHAAGRRAGQALPRSRAEAHGGALAHRAGIVVPAIVIGIEELFEPLQKLEIVLEPTLDQFINGYYLKVRWARNMQTGERACGETKCNGNKIRIHTVWILRDQSSLASQSTRTYLTHLR